MGPLACAPRCMHRACAARRARPPRVPPLSHPHAPQVSASESPGHVASSHVDVAGVELSAEEQPTSARAHSDYANSDYQSSDTASEAGAEVADEAVNPAADPADDSELDDVGVEAPDAIKIDVEGAELSILKPFFASASPVRFPGLIILECMQRNGLSDAAKLALQNGYRMRRQAKMNAILERAS